MRLISDDRPLNGICSSSFPVDRGNDKRLSSGRFSLKTRPNRDVTIRPFSFFFFLSPSVRQPNDRTRWVRVLFSFFARLDFLVQILERTNPSINFTEHARKKNKKKFDLSHAMSDPKPIPESDLSSTAGTPCIGRTYRVERPSAILPHDRLFVRATTSVLLRLVVWWRVK